MTPGFKKLFIIRFIAYCAIITGFLVIVAEFGPIAQAEVIFRLNQIIGRKYTLASDVITSEQYKESSSSAEPAIEQDPLPEPERPLLGSFLSFTPSIIRPVSTDYGIVIEKIGANAKVIPDVDPGNESEYSQALQSGVAAAKGSTEPGQPGNIFIFSHSIDAPWNVIRYNAIFYLLRELNEGDRVSIFYKNRRYDYLVFDKVSVDPTDTSFLTNRYDKPVLTLQTCDPPGTLLNRLIVRAKLAGT